MGYTTDFNGTLELSRELTKEEKDFINTFSLTRRMKRDVNKLMELYDGKYGIPNPKDNTPEGIYGKDGEYFVRDDNFMGQTKDDSIIDFNIPPGQVEFDSKEFSDFNFRWEENRKRIKNGVCQPGLWCQWYINDENELEWDGGEKFYEYTNWLKYLIKHFFEPWGVKLNGTIEWKGEDRDDFGKIVVVDNVVTEKIGKIAYE